MGSGTTHKVYKRSSHLEILCDFLQECVSFHGIALSLESDVPSPVQSKLAALYLWTLWMVEYFLWIQILRVNLYLHKIESLNLTQLRHAISAVWYVVQKKLTYPWIWWFMEMDLMCI